MNALADSEVGRYLNEHFVSSYLKLGTFRVANWQKQGGNVASYFTLVDGAVLHVVPGPVDAVTLLREARWVVETRKLAAAFSHGDLDTYKEFFRKAHAERLRREHRTVVEDRPRQGTFERLAKRLPPRGQAHLLLATRPLAPIDQVYDVVFEQVLGEKVSMAPVARK